jgi:hypothetical protein
MRANARKGSPNVLTAAGGLDFRGYKAGCQSRSSGPGVSAE